MHSVIFWGSHAGKGLNKFLESRVGGLVQAPFENSSAQKIFGEQGVLWLLRPLLESSKKNKSHNGRLDLGERARARDVAGGFLRQEKLSGSIELEFHGATSEEVKGALLGFTLASYNFLNCVKDVENKTVWNVRVAKGKLDKKWLQEAAILGASMNLARHLTNLPASVTQAKALTDFFSQFFSKRKNLKIEVWGPQELKKDGFGLLTGVGAGSKDGAHFVHLKYRPKLSKKIKPQAFVGKGVIFDTGGLDIKPSSGMRLMKKDMAGVAAIAGICHFVTELEIKTPCDFYLPLAENSISETATRPGDVHKSRAGHLVEIDNTDAEGRLVMADALDYAVTQKGADEPSAVFDVSTLTGAMRVALGLDMAGYFSNDDALAAKIEKVARAAGEYAWRMPLLQKYSRELGSQFADFKNSSTSGFGGAITAALFLEKFVRDVPWVHFDVMSWNNSSDGALSDGANAQCMQILAEYLLS